MTNIINSKTVKILFLPVSPDEIRTSAPGLQLRINADWKKLVSHDDDHIAVRSYYLFSYEW